MQIDSAYAMIILYRHEFFIVKFLIGYERENTGRNIMNFDYIRDFEELSYGMFVHFGLYSVEGKGEWYLNSHPKASREKYEKLPSKFKITKNWAKNLVRTAKEAGAKYITLTTRHHDGFSLYDTKGLNDYDAPHSASKRDLIAEFVQECRAGGIVPFFYHTLLDWHNKDYKENFPAYIDYLVKSVEILCRNYGKIGGFWFDGMWDKPNEDWQEDRLYGTIRKYQPQAMIVNNTGLSALGKLGHRELDSVTFERGAPQFVDRSEKPIAGEMCQVLNDHWGYAKNDCNYKSVKELIENIVECRKYNCNFLLNTGLKGNGEVNETDKCLLREIGKWVRANKGFIYGAKAAEWQCEGGFILEKGDELYAVIENVPMSADPNVTAVISEKKISLDERLKIRRGVWLDSGEKIKIRKNEFDVKPFTYGTSLSVRVAKLEKE